MKAIKIAVVMILLLNGIYSLTNWLSSDSGQQEQQEVMLSQVAEVQEVEAAEGLSLLALTSLVKEIRSGQELERRLNEKDGINNIDLNSDEVVDYLFVSEFGDKEQKIGYSITTQPEKNEVQEVAEVVVERNNDRAEIQVVGNEQIYGTNAIFNDWTPIEREQAQAVETGADGIQRHSSYFFPSPLWISPWFFGFYPSFFSPFPIMSPPLYASRIGRYNTGSIGRGYNNYQNTSAKKITNPNKGKVANKGIARSLRKPTSTQKQFQSTRASNLRSGGFGRTSSSSTSTRVGKSGAASSFGTSSSSNVNRFGSTKSSSRSSFFGGQSRSYSSGSFRSRSVGSRSFSFGK